MPHIERIQVVWADIDAAGHVNNATYFTYMETARTRYYLRLVGRSDVRDVDLIVARATCDFHRGLRFGESVEVVTWPGRIGTTSWTFRYAMRTPDGEIVAVGETVQVGFDYAKNQKKPIDPGLRRKLEAEMAQGPGFPIPE